MQPDSRHVVLFLAAPNIFLPVRKLGIYRSEGHEDALTEGATVLHEPGIYAGDVLMENPIELPAQACPTFCFRSLATSSAGSSATKRRKGQRERLTFVSTITTGIPSFAGWVLIGGGCFRPESIFSPIQGCRLP